MGNYNDVSSNEVNDTIDKFKYDLVDDKLKSNKTNKHRWIRRS